MLREVEIDEFSRLRAERPVVDVRSPKEFQSGHIPSAHSMPVFTDEERAIVGTLYKSRGKDIAINKALEIVEPKRPLFLDKVKQLSTDRKVLVHCWRGGMRSRNFSEFLAANGFEVAILKGGYKTYRNSLLATLNRDWKLIVLGGMTGTGKTEILEELRIRGHQVICLESIAHHRGSSFGKLGQNAQPTTEQFQNNLGEAWSVLNIEEHVFVEDESQAIGSVRIPDHLFARMRECPVINVQVSLDNRADRLVVEYGKFDIALLKESVLRIERRLGHEWTARAVEDLTNGNLRDVAISTLKYYDKAYTFGLSKRNASSVGTVECTSGDAKENALLVESYLDSRGQKLWQK